MSDVVSNSRTKSKRLGGYAGYWRQLDLLTIESSRWGDAQPLSGMDVVNSSSTEDVTNNNNGSGVSSHGQPSDNTQRNIRVLTDNNREVTATSGTNRYNYSAKKG